MGSIDTIRSDASLSSPVARLRGRFTLQAVLVRIEKMAERRRTRRALMALSDSQLKDIGISRADAYREGIRPFWD
ncbi:DUF1127 domain-containing protein [Afifella sp. IM 167]|uniref:DUF1127 domain-containing protein n=1 Tax=Afifella sp. IM 167 TaxID=2033586 RepID=UPI001CCF73A3|nr:DUF1127 domain-containing protein [Afifella sp. IM 167]MBZ8134698.1 hypothetical protein [Afifella sp. IM 167]